MPHTSTGLFFTGVELTHSKMGKSYVDFCTHVYTLVTTIQMNIFITLWSSLLLCPVHNAPELTTLLMSITKDYFGMFLNFHMSMESQMYSVSRDPSNSMSFFTLLPSSITGDWEGWRRTGEPWRDHTASPPLPFLYPALFYVIIAQWVRVCTLPSLGLGIHFSSITATCINIGNLTENP